MINANRLINTGISLTDRSSAVERFSSVTQISSAWLKPVSHRDNMANFMSQQNTYREKN